LSSVLLDMHCVPWFYGTTSLKSVHPDNQIRNYPKPTETDRKGKFWNGTITKLKRSTLFFGLIWNSSIKRACCAEPKWWWWWWVLCTWANLYWSSKVDQLMTTDYSSVVVGLLIDCLILWSRELSHHWVFGNVITGPSFRTCQVIKKVRKLHA